MKRFFCLAAIFSIHVLVHADESADNDEQVHVWGESHISRDAGYTSPSSVYLPEDFVSINAVTTEDLVKFAPSLVIRRRFIGDSNGTLGLRGSNMFQTSRAMVFADGVPLHYLLQSRWNGAPRWSMVSANEIKKVEVLYGPFSAEYSGNAMGGVVLIETGIPQDHEIHADIKAFSQEFSAYGFDDTVQGHTGFFSYGNKVSDLSYYFSFNRLDNDSQPQTFRGATRAENGATDVNGGIEGVDARGREQLWYGDTGIVNTTTNNYKVKLGYDVRDWQVLLNLAFEDRRADNTGNSYIKDGAGNTLWQGENLVNNGYNFSFDSTRLNESIRDRESLSMGLRARGELSEHLELEFNLNNFDIRKDNARSSQTSPSQTSPDDPSFTSAGQLNAYNDSGWKTGEIKLRAEDLWIEGLAWVTGFRHEAYDLSLDQYDVENYRLDEYGELTSRFGGTTEINALFLQASVVLSPMWDVAAGIRYEDFRSKEGFYSEYDAEELSLVAIPREKRTEISPKFSLGFSPNEFWQYRYSVAKAYRFPIVEELFRQYEDYNSINEASPELNPENGLHQNFMLEYALDTGYVRMNIFHETIHDAIESQSTTTDSGQSLSTFIPLDETQAKGLEFVANATNMLRHMDIRFNVTYTRAEIIRNEANSDWEGNDYPRMPKWRSKLLATYHVSPSWNAGLSVQYASDAYGRIDNTDTVDQVYGAQDAYTHIGLKTNYSLNENFTVSFGIDNLSNDISYVAHPWPGRTAYLGLAFKQR